MLTKEITLTNSSGLHARPASLWVQMASHYQSSIKLKFNESEVNGKSILGILSLGLATGSKFELIVDGEDEEEAVSSLETLVINFE